MKFRLKKTQMFYYQQEEIYLWNMQKDMKVISKCKIVIINQFNRY